MTTEAVMAEQVGVEPEPALPPALGTLRSRAIRGSFWTMVGYVGANLLRFGSNLILTRLLFPEVFGLMAMVSVFIQGLHMFSDIGIGPSVIQNPRGDEADFLNTAWTIQATRGMILWLCSIAVSFPLAHLYGRHQFLWLIPSAAFTAALDGFTSTNYYTRSRHLTLGVTTLMDLGTYLLNILVMIVWAHFWPSVWALIGGSLISSAVHLILTHTVVPGMPNRPHWDPEIARALFRFGRWIFVSTMLTFLASQCDRLMFGIKIPLTMLGVYSIAAALAGVPTQAIIRIAGPITFSVYSRLGTSRESVATAFGRIRGPLLVFGGWAICGLIVLGPAVIHLLYDRRYTEAGWILQFLVVSAWFEIMETTNGSALLALGLSRWVAAANASKLVAMVALIPAGFWVGGFRGALAAVVLSEVARYAISAVAVFRERVGDVGRDMAVTGLLGLTAAVALFAEHQLLRLGGPPAWPAIAATALVSVPWAMLAWGAWCSLRPAKSKIEFDAMAPAPTAA